METEENQKQVIVLLGSPRKKGNSTVLANQISTQFLQGVAGTSPLAANGAGAG